MLGFMDAGVLLELRGNSLLVHFFDRVGIGTALHWAAY